MKSVSIRSLPFTCLQLQYDSSILARFVLQECKENITLLMLQIAQNLKTEAKYVYIYARHTFRTWGVISTDTTPAVASMDIIG